MKEMSPLEELRHSCSHVLATAILRLYPETQLDIGPPTDNGFYYDIDLDKKLDADDLEKIEAENLERRPKLLPNLQDDWLLKLRRDLEYYSSRTSQLESNSPTK